ncbi:hypothetical protein GCM10009733_025770 [Nonomuraea maheshkhaliensis]|uniref:Uncharacterized protein n=1 Tax=Nonomuraea maheshkhaliensis TaxID=419590 RepID=A0ABN2F2L2_9ACTN
MTGEFLGSGGGMKKFLKLVVARYLSKTPLGLVVLGIGWFLGRRHKRRRAERENAPRPRRATPARRPVRSGHR